MAKEYHGVDMDELSKKSLGGSGKFKKLEWWKAVKPGTSYEIRILPPVGSMPTDAPWFEAQMYFNGFTQKGFQVPGRDGQMFARAISSLVHHAGATDDEDPMVALTEWIGENIDSEQTVRNWRVSRSFQMNIVYDGQVRPWGAPKTAAEAIQTLMKGKLGDITNPKKGRPVEVTRFEKSPWYTIQALDPESLDLPGWEDQCTEFPELVSLFTADQIYAILWENIRSHVPLKSIFPGVDFVGLHKAMYSGGSGGGGGGEEAATKKTTKKPAPPSKAAKKTAKKGGKK